MLPGRATPEGTARFAKRHPRMAFRNVGGLRVSSLGLGSYLGATDESSRQAYQEATLVCLRGGVNVLDTASNYRDRASERDVGAGLRRFVQEGGARDEVVVSTKVGFLHLDVDEPDWMASADPDQVVAGHCLDPEFLRAQIARSRESLGLECLDVLHVHNPEYQLAHGVSKEVLMARLGAAFRVLEEAADAGHINVYGIATWNGLRAPPGHQEHLPLVKVVHEAGQAAMAQGRVAASHRFRAVQLPVNLAMTEAALLPSQPWKFGDHTALQATTDLGLFVQASASLAQARLQGRVAPEWREALGTQEDLETALQFARSVPGVHAALVGMGRPEHVRQNLLWAKAQAPDTATVGLMLGPGGPHG